MRTRLLIVISVFVPVLMLVPLVIAGTENTGFLSALNWQAPTSTPFQAQPAFAPVLLTPGDGETVTSNEVTLSVAYMDDAEVIEYLVYYDNFFLKKRLAVGQSWTLTLADDTYSWKARGLNVYGFGPFSDLQYFTVAGGLAPSPTGSPTPGDTPTSEMSDLPFMLVAPLLGERVLSPVTFSFFLGYGTFQLESVGITEIHGSWSGGMDRSTCCAIDLPPGDYIWNVTGCRPLFCATSPDYYFTVISEPDPTATPTLAPTAERPPAPTPLSPPHRWTTTDRHPWFSWTAVSGAIRYRIMVYNHKSPHERTVDIRENSPVPSIQLSVPLQPDRYFWRVRARANGRWSLWSVRFTLWVVDEIIPSNTPLPPTPTFTVTASDTPLPSTDTPIPPTATYTHASTVTDTLLSPTSTSQSPTPAQFSATPSWTQLPSATMTPYTPVTPVTDTPVTKPVTDPPTLLDPTDMAVLTSDYVRFRIFSPLWTTHMTIEISDSTNSVLLTETQSRATYAFYYLYVPMDGQRSRQFKWRARGENQFGAGPWSDYWSFEVQLPPTIDPATITHTITPSPTITPTAT